MEFVNRVTRWIDRWIPDRVLSRAGPALRARVVVGLSVVAACISLVVQPLRLMQEGQHWIPLASWSVCTLLLIINPVVMRLTGRLTLSAALFAGAVLIGSVGVAFKEGGLDSPNALVLIVVPLTATVAGGWRSGLSTTAVVSLCTASLYTMQISGLIETRSAIHPDTLLSMRALISLAIAVGLYIVVLFYEWERDRSELNLAQAAQDLATAQQAVVDASKVKMELIQAEQRALQRDLELTGAVQRLLLPRHDTLETEHAALAGVNVPASQAGGDWWLTETLPGGALRVLLGDATGHGAAPAMITAVVAGAYRTLQETDWRDALQVLEALHRVLADMGAGKYTMPLGLLDVEPDGQAQWYSAAAPPLLLLRASGKLETITASGTALGASHHRVGTRRLSLEVGDRLLAATDGVLEMRNEAGRELGLRRLSRMFQRMADASTCELRDSLAEDLRRLRGAAEQEDDMTFAVVELRSRQAVSQSRSACAGRHGIGPQRNPCLRSKVSR